MTDRRKASTIKTVDEKYNVTISPAPSSQIRVTVTNARDTVVTQFAVDILTLAHALELATGARTKADANGTEVSLV